MNEARVARIEEKYSKTKKLAEEKQIEIGPGRGRSQALSASGKPKSFRSSVLRLVKYMTLERGLILAALFCSLLHTVSALGAGYLLRPLINGFVSGEGEGIGMTGQLIVLAVIYGISVLTQWLQQRLMLMQ